MHRIAIALAVLMTAGTAAASEQDDAVAQVKQIIDDFNNGAAKSALATCASPVSIVDEFPPYAWQGANACADWAGDFEANAKKNAITDSVVTLHKPRHVEVSGDRAYVVVPADYAYKVKGKKASQKGSVMAAALKKGPDGWRITGWSWATR